MLPPFLQQKDRYHTTSEAKTAAYLKKDRSFIIKVQVGVDLVTRKPKRDQALMAYNQDRKFQCLIEQTDPGHKILYDRIAAEGVQGLKAYFNAYVNKSKKLIVITNPVLQPQPW